MTTIAEIKSSLHQQVANTEDEKILLKMQIFFNSIAKKNENKIVAYTSQGKSLTAKEYKASVEESIGQYRTRKIRSQKEIEQSL